jgi:hypothetical protein
MKRVTYKNIIERQNNKNDFKDFPKLKDILVDLSVKNVPTVTRTLRLVGNPIYFKEYSNKKWIPGEKGRTEKVDFPDSEINKKITRIGHDDEDLCPWKQMGYVGSTKYAQRCLELQEDGTWFPKILCKGPSIFDEFFTWEQGRHEESEKDPTLTTFLGGDFAPSVRIKATYDSSKLGDVNYKVFVNSKDTELTEDMINLLREVREPSADELNSLMAEYNADRENDESMAEWRDYFEYSYDLKRIFKFTPPMEETSEETSEVKVSDILDDSDDVEKNTKTMVSDETSENSEAESEGDDFADITW